MDASRSWIAAVGLAAAAAGAIGVVALRGMLSDPSPEASPGPGGAMATAPDLAAELAALRDELHAEREATRALAEEVARLRADVERRLGDAGAAEPPAALDEPERAQARQRPTEPPAARSEAWFDAQALLELGALPDEVDELRERYDQNQLELLYLRDRATRDGWIGQPRFRKEARELQMALHEELGDADYDRLRYATGQPNRVVLDGVFAASPAERAGFEAGDVILRYGERAIFTPRDLTEATTGGRAGTTVSVDVLRGDVLLRLYVPRGPLGTRLRSDRRPPDARW